MHNDGLVLTLGHGASAILILDNKIVNGYQLERLSGIKGDSRFPGLAIEEIEKFGTIPHAIPIYISHWEPSGDVDKLNKKYYNPGYLAQRFPRSSIITTDCSITHHDTHAFSALAYHPYMDTGSHICVADGFGTLGEVMSFYKRTSTGLELIKRVFGFNQSLGLLYQYATDYVGLKQNQDEWKLNAMATQVRKDVASSVIQEGYAVAKDIISHQQACSLGSPDDPVTNLGALSHAHAHVVSMLRSRFNPQCKPEIALFLQTIVEEVMTYWIDELNIKDLTIVGGCFLNVQLNGYLSSKVDSICAMPLSGDEGTGLGLFKRYNADFHIPEDLCFGRRDLKDDTSICGLSYRSAEGLPYAVVDALKRGYIVNVIHGNMEFGPRAYCNTSTLALPTANNRQYINLLNDRDESMPMCPVICYEDFKRMFEPECEIFRSIEHMIMALPINENTVNELNEGVTHELMDGTLTGRPQVVSHTSWIYSVCEELGPLINTSFNNHGLPICYDMKSVIKCHKYMLDKDIERRVITFVVPESCLDSFQAY